MNSLGRSKVVPLTRNESYSSKKFPDHLKYGNFVKKRPSTALKKTKPIIKEVQKKRGDSINNSMTISVSSL
jgi:hypothetical protein